jgi:hypothetical protein
LQVTDAALVGLLAATGAGSTGFAVIDELAGGVFAAAVDLLAGAGLAAAVLFAAGADFATPP